MIGTILKRKKVIFIAGDRNKETAYFANFVLKDNFTIFSSDKIPSIFDFFSILKSDIVIIEDNNSEDHLKVKRFLELSQYCVFVITETKEKARIKKILQGSLEKLIFVLDFSVAKKLKKRKKKDVLTFGIDRKRAAFYITDIRQREKETNFKVNYGANTIPFWVKEKLKNKEIYAVLPALCLAKIFKLNLANVSHRIREELTSGV